MIRQTLAIGNTGAQLVSKFNINSGLANLRVYNVEDYGAVHNGTTDDTAKIQDAINACFAAGGGIVYFPNGIYSIQGALNHDVDGVDVNAQLYFPITLMTGTDKTVIKLLGETPPNHSMGSTFSNALVTKGVILKSTITGYDMMSSVIASRGPTQLHGDFNYTDPWIENICIQVNHDPTNGVTMSGINLFWSDCSYLKNIYVLSSTAPLLTVQPAVHHFGICMGHTNTDVWHLAENIRCESFYYGFMSSECGSVRDLVVLANYIGLHLLRSVGVQMFSDFGAAWNTYGIASQQETIGDITAHNAHVYFDHASFEAANLETYWFSHEDTILDVGNLLYGEMLYEANEGTDPVTKANGGLNLLVKNIRWLGNFHWATTTRPTAPIAGTTGYNDTTNKLEVWNGAIWNDCF